MNAAALARIHAESFTTPRPWTEEEMAGFLSDPLCDLVAEKAGFALIRSIAGESELLTLAVVPSRRRMGQGRAILAQVLNRARARSSESIFLEVAADNLPAIALYDQAGFSCNGRRPGYYRATDGTRIDALLMLLAL